MREMRVRVAREMSEEWRVHTDEEEDCTAFDDATCGITPRSIDSRLAEIFLA